jgi:hypothetical protein
MAHHLGDDDPVVAVGRAVEPVDRLRGDLERGRESDRGVGLGDVVVDRLWERDDVEPGSCEAQRVLLRAAPADADQGVEAGPAVSTIAPVMSTTAPSTSIRCGLSRLVPRIVPPTVRMPASVALSSRIRRSSARPRKPSRKPTIRIR